MANRIILPSLTPTVDRNIKLNSPTSYNRRIYLPPLTPTSPNSSNSSNFITSSIISPTNPNFNISQAREQPTQQLPITPNIQRVLRNIDNLYSEVKMTSPSPSSVNFDVSSPESVDDLLSERESKREYDMNHRYIDVKDNQVINQNCGSYYYQDAPLIINDHSKFWNACQHTQLDQSRKHINDNNIPPTTNTDNTNTNTNTADSNEQEQEQDIDNTTYQEDFDVYDDCNYTIKEYPLNDPEYPDNVLVANDIHYLRGLSQIQLNGKPIVPRLHADYVCDGKHILILERLGIDMYTSGILRAKLNPTLAQFTQVMMNTTNNLLLFTESEINRMFQIAMLLTHLRLIDGDLQLKSFSRYPADKIDDDDIVLNDLAFMGEAFIESKDLERSKIFEPILNENENRYGQRFVRVDNNNNNIQNIRTKVGSVIKNQRLQIKPIFGWPTKSSKLGGYQCFPGFVYYRQLPWSRSTINQENTKKQKIYMFDDLSIRNNFNAFILAENIMNTTNTWILMNDKTTIRPFMGYHINSNWNLGNNLNAASRNDQKIDKMFKDNFRNYCPYLPDVDSSLLSGSENKYPIQDFIKTNDNYLKKFYNIDISKPYYIQINPKIIQKVF
jgi:hypothetical protein